MYGKILEEHQKYYRSNSCLYTFLTEETMRITPVCCSVDVDEVYLLFLRNKSLKKGEDGAESVSP